MDILNLIIKQVYFDEIMTGTKKQEFREIRPNSQKKYCEVDADGYCVERNGKIVPRHYDAIRFYVGYHKDRDTALVEVTDTHIELIEDDNGNLIIYENKGKEYCAALAVYDLGNIIEKNVH